MIGRIFRVVRTPITLLILFGVLLYGAWWGYNNIIKPIPPLPPQPCVEQSLPQGQLKTSQVVVTVLQRRRPQGLRGRCGPKPAGQGLPSRPDNQHCREDQKTVIVGADGNDPEVLFVESFFKRPTYAQTGELTVRWTCSWATSTPASTREAKTTYQVNGDTVCLPSQTPSPTPALGG